MSIDDVVIQRTGSIRLTEAAHWFGMEPDTAVKKASTQSLPIPVFKGKSQKSPWLVKLDDIAAYLNDQYLEYLEDFNAVNAE